MRASARSAAVAVALLMAAADCAAQGIGGAVQPRTKAAAEDWSFSASGSYYSLRDQSDYLMAVGTAERGSLLLEARYNYEALNTGSAFVGWKFSGGDKLTYELTPMLGAVFGATQGIAPGFKASLAYGIVDFYTEAEYLYDTKVRENSFTYAWSELGVTPAKWLRFGVVGQRTRAYRSDRDIQRGPFVQFVAGKATLGLFVFNPDDRANRIGVLSLGLEF
jgi:hypothetical protein